MKATFRYLTIFVLLIIDYKGIGSMTFFLQKVSGIFFRGLSDLFYIKILGRIPIFYYSGELNVGDALNSFLIGSISGKKTYLVKTKYFRHILAVGSVIQHANKNSLVFGSGVISPDLMVERKEFARVGALRGKLTRDFLLENCRCMDGIDVLDIPLGDPALLLPKLYSLSTSRKKRYRVGIIPHYVDKSCQAIQDFLPNLPDDVTLIDVQKELEPFLADLAMCEFVISSSLHGLIIADAYGVPNLWVRFSGNVFGGDFKFLDYYSVTDAVEPQAIFVGSDKKLRGIVDDLPSIASVKEYRGSLDALYSGLKDLIQQV